MALTTARLVAILCIGAPAMVTTTEGYTAAEVAVCNTIQQGDTAATISWRLTGSAQELYQPWFQIMDGSSRFIPKSQYARIRPGWRACIVKETIESSTVQPATQFAKATSEAPVIAGGSPRPAARVRIR